MTRWPVWLWLNLLSLDAPLVAILWQDHLSRSLPCLIRPPARIVLALTVWAVYLADRLIDVRGPAPNNESARHSFYRSHRRGISLLFLLVIAADGLTAAFWLRPQVFSLGLWLAAGVATYLLLYPLARRHGWHKRVFAGVLFSAGIFLAPATLLPLETLLLPAALFAALCTANLFLIQALHRGRIPPWKWLLLASLAILPLLTAASAFQHAIAASAAALCVLAFFGLKLETEKRRVLADAALLSPLLFR